MSKKLFSLSDYLLRTAVFVRVGKKKPRCVGASLSHIYFTSQPYKKVIKKDNCVVVIVCYQFENPFQWDWTTNYVYIFRRKETTWIRNRAENLKYQKHTIESQYTQHTLTNHVYEYRVVIYHSVFRIAFFSFNSNSKEIK